MRRCIQREYFRLVFQNMAIVKPQAARVLCSCTMDLVSRVQRPYIFAVTVTGEPPHAYTRKYEIASYSEDAAAQVALDTFVREMSAQERLLAAICASPEKRCLVS
jgi:hypothetical protein